MVILTDSLAGDIQAVVGAFQDGRLRVPPTSAKVASWPIVGYRLYGVGLQASQKLDSVLAQWGRA